MARRKSGKKFKNPLRANVGGLHNQIDFILSPRRILTLFTDALSYMLCLFQHRSDHSLVVASVLLGRIYKLPKTHSRCEKPRDNRALSGPGSEETREKFQASVARQLQQLRVSIEEKGDEAPENGVSIFYTNIQKIIHTAADDTLPMAPRRIND